jgi:hypothetical protein
MVRFLGIDWISVVKSGIYSVQARMHLANKLFWLNSRMKNKIVVTLCCVFTCCLICFRTNAQTTPVPIQPTLVSYPWAAAELIEPATLAGTLSAATAQVPLILNIGAVEDIKGATHIGAVSKTDHMTTLISTVTPLPKNTLMVIYCGCCPFTKCPNIRPAFEQLKKMGFTNVKVLDLPVNLQTNWIGKGYPLAGK